ncbi:hypothetical protein Mapa_001464 [Marchantia paleacea]|nr:hypothetical protein Mapa_001464 [Marchantia paleacea]
MIMMDQINENGEDSYCTPKAVQHYNTLNSGRLNPLLQFLFCECTRQSLIFFPRIRQTHHRVQRRIILSSPLAFPFGVPTSTSRSRILSTYFPSASTVRLNAASAVHQLCTES